MLGCRLHLLLGIALLTLYGTKKSRAFRCLWMLEGPHDAANRTETGIDAAALDTSLEFLRRRLANRAYIHGEEFTVTDLNTAAVLLRPRFRTVASSDARIQDWFNGCIRRSALQRVMAD